MKTYYQLSSYLKDRFGRRLKKISIDAGFTCPNRDGTKGNRGCIFCSEGGSGDFASNCRGENIAGKGDASYRAALVEAALDDAMKEAGYKAGDAPGLIAYFQAFTNTYGEIADLEKIYMAAAGHPAVAVISIGTRPDCLSDDVIALLSAINRIKPVWVELGLQTIHEETARYIRRGYELSVYDKAVEGLCKAGMAQIVTHLILGLPGEDKDMMLKSVRYVADTAERHTGTDFGVKLALLHVLRDTDLEGEYLDGRFMCLEFEEYVDIVVDALCLLPSDMVVHRITGDGNGAQLVAPLWSKNKRKVLNEINRHFYLGNI